MHKEPFKFPQRTPNPPCCYCRRKSGSGILTPRVKKGGMKDDMGGGVGPWSFLVWKPKQLPENLQACVLANKLMHPDSPKTQSLSFPDNRFNRNLQNETHR